MSLFSELQRRNVIRVAITYLVAAWVLIQVMEIATDAFGAPEWVLKVFIVALVLGFVPMLIFSWVYELTPEGLKRESEVPPDASVTAHTARRLNIVVIVLLLAVVALVAVERVRPPAAERASAPEIATTQDASSIDSIAVLPFEDFSPQRDQAHLAEGLADTLLHMLAQVQGLRVSARTSSFSFRGTDADIAEIGRELGVGAVLEGSVQRSGETLRIIAQLIRVADQSHLWSKTFDRPTGDIFAVQDEIANAVVAALQPADAPASQVALASNRTSVKAYEHFVRGDRLWQVRSREAIEQAIEEFRAAIAADPGYAPAHAGLAIAYLFSTYYGDKSMKEVRLAVEQATEQALALDPQLALAYAARGQLLANVEDLEGAEAAYRRAIELDPSDATTYAWLAGLLINDIKRWDESRSLLEKAYELDPRNLFVLGRYASNLSVFGDYNRAVEVYRRGVALDPEAPRAYANLAALHAQFGRHDDAIRAHLAQIERAPASPGPYLGIAGQFLRLDDQDAALEWFDKARALNPNSEYWSGFFLRREDHPRLVDEMEAMYARNPQRPQARAELCYARSIVGEYEQVVELCGPQVADVVGPNQEPLQLSALSDAMAVYWASVQLGNEATAGRLMDEMLRLAREGETSGFADASLHEFLAMLAAMRGDRTELYAQLGKAVELGYCDGRAMDNLPWFDAYRDEAEFRALLDDMRARQTQMRSSLRVEGF
ncbi:tetratricopeptide repeat protein [Wenzhouxiangella sp. XN24]|uniref:tetratricopeptide repeat protein n=1 Tax=Wenzhouxiangella sp. XN24 TaxID=2713569 RepID=UPI0013EDC2B3|nr:tetratricopeptide repeat protein [Wenzhouxiangella sp. XN24]NGX15002.1 tetratricopeptide repeat protein [Wenzhouxiangella sp. XN24]